MSYQYRVSQYNIYLPINNSNMLMVQGINGSFDIVDRHLAELLQSVGRHECDESIIETSFISDEDFSCLLRRGYITRQSITEEFAFANKLSLAIEEHAKKHICITLIPTYNCNFRCEYCFERYLHNTKTGIFDTKMSPQMVDAIFNQLKIYQNTGNTIDEFCLFGGEPLLIGNKDIVSYICDNATKMSLPITCVSNGYFLDEYLELISKYPFRDLQITLDGIREEHDSRRFLIGGKGTFDRIIHNVGQALERGVNITLRTNVNRKNISAMKTMIQLYQENGWTSYPNFRYYFKSTASCYDAVKDAYSDAELIEELMQSLQIKSKCVFQFNNLYSSLEKSIYQMLHSRSFAPLQSSFCGATSGAYVVDPFGEIYPCWEVIGKKEDQIGHVDLNSGKFVFHGAYSLWKERNISKLNKCKVCPYLLFCGGGCAAHAKAANGSIYNAFCENYQSMFNYVAVQVCKNALGL